MVWIVLPGGLGVYGDTTVLQPEPGLCTHLPARFSTPGADLSGCHTFGDVHLRFPHHNAHEASQQENWQEGGHINCLSWYYLMKCSVYSSLNLTFGDWLVSNTQ